MGDRYIKNLERRLDRFNEQMKEMETLHKGNEQNYTYWGGFDLGYLKGKIYEIENTIEEIREEMRIENKRNNHENSKKQLD